MPAVLGALLLAALAAQAAPPNTLYVGGGFSAPHFQDPVNGISGSGTGVGGKLFAGYRLTRNFELETGAVDLGHIDDSSGKVYGHGQYVDAIGLLPLSEQWSLFGSFGVAHVALHTSTLVNNVTTVANDSGTGPKLGLGFEFAVANNVGFRAEFERYKPPAFGGRPAIDQGTLSVSMDF
jgi:OOP family OmpA-OmpF porin